MIKSILSLLILFSFAASIHAQDALFSRYNGSPMLLNPASTGVIPLHARRVGLSYRSQWASVLKDDAYITKAVSFDNRICTPTEDFFGVGGSVLYDGSGFASSKPALSRLNLMASVAFVKHLGGRAGVGTHWRLAAGAEAGIIQHWLDDSDLNFHIQFDGEEFDQNMPGETFSDLSFRTWDAGAGLMLYSVSYRQTKHNSENRTADGLSVGVSAKHLNKPRYKFFDNSDADLNRRWAFHGMGSLELTQNKLAFRIIPVVIWQKPFYQASLTGEFLLNLNDSGFYTHLGAGVRRSGHAEKSGHYDAILLTSRFDVRNMALAFSYDVNVSSLTRASQGRGAWELSVLWHFGKSNCECHCECPN